jgi:hypothetical protein
MTLPTKKELEQDPKVMLAATRKAMEDRQFPCGRCRSHNVTFIGDPIIAGGVPVVNFVCNSCGCPQHAKCAGLTIGKMTLERKA